MSFQRHRELWFSLLLLLLITTRIHAEVITCYFGTWAAHRTDDGAFQFENIDPYKCTHIIYAFADINDDGTIKISDPDLDIDKEGYARFNRLKEQNSELKTLIAVGGASAGSKRFSDVVSNPALRQNLKRSALDFLRQHNFNGLDIDWEYPGQLGGAPSDKDNFSKLIQELWDEFNNNGFLLTAAVPAIPSSVDESFDVPVLSRYLHFIHVMTYDLHGTWDQKTGENAPLYASSADVSDLEKTLNVEASIRGWKDRGADPQKLVLGMPAYGRSFTLADQNQNGIGAPISGPGNAGPITQEPGYIGYNEICRDQEWTTVWNDQQKVPYAFNGDQWVGYDNVESIKLKVQFAKQQGLAGAMVWSIESDDFAGWCGEVFPILSAINEEYGTGNRKHLKHHTKNISSHIKKHIKKHTKKHIKKHIKKHVKEQLKHKH